jgi:hypothetical protein
MKIIQFLAVIQERPEFVQIPAAFRFRYCVITKAGNPIDILGQAYYFLGHSSYQFGTNNQQAQWSKK